MLLAQIDAASAAQFPLESVSLVEIARDVVSLLAPGIIAEGKAITLDAGSGHPVARGRRDAIAAALRNLIENAVRVAPTGSTVTRRLGPDPVIAVGDGGGGLATDRLRDLGRRWGERRGGK